MASNEPKVNHEVDEFFLSNYDTHSSSFTVLDADITEKEIYDAIHSLKINKACGYDNVLNEYFITCKDVLMPWLHLLFYQESNKFFLYMAKFKMDSKMAAIILLNHISITVWSKYKHDVWI